MMPGILKRDVSRESQMSNSGLRQSIDFEVEIPDPQKLSLVPKEGYLLKRSSGALKVWSRYFLFHYFLLKLFY